MPRPNRASASFTTRAGLVKFILAHCARTCVSQESRAISAPSRAYHLHLVHYPRGFEELGCAKSPSSARVGLDDNTGRTLTALRMHLTRQEFLCQRLGGH